MRADLRPGNDVSWSVFVGGAYEPNEIAFLAATLKPGITLVDVGANEGLFTLIGALRVGDTGHVFAFEPSSREFERLKANIDLNRRLDNVEPLRFALYNHSGPANLSCAEFGPRDFFQGRGSAVAFHPYWRREVVGYKRS